MLRYIFRLLAPALFVLASLSPAAALYDLQPPADGLGKISQALGDVGYIQSSDGWAALQLSGEVEIAYHYIDDNPAAFLFPKNPREDWIFHPRLTLKTDIFLGPHLYGFAKFRIDDGFHPGLDETSGRVDVAFLRYTIPNTEISLQAGRFPDAFGGYYGRHEPWDSAFITAPLAYEHYTSVADHAAPTNAAAFANRATVLDVKKTWLPILWNPGYSDGLGIFGNAGKLGYAFSFKNAAASSRPDVWDDNDWSVPAYSARVTYSPSAAWQFGSSFHLGHYLRESAEPTLPAGTDRGDFEQILAGVDLRWAKGYWQVWAELMWNRFEVPNTGDADTWSTFVEVRRKFNRHLSGGVRVNYQWYPEIDGWTWDTDAIRTDLALTWRFNRYVQITGEYNWLDENGGPENGEQRLAGRFVWRF